MIIEGLLTTETPEGQPHVAPMGPVVNPDLTQWVLRPFQSSRTFEFLRQTPTCVFHVIDDVLPLAQSALGYKVDLDYQRIDGGGWMVRQACHWYRLRVASWEVSEPRTSAIANVTGQGQIRSFWGWNRAKHAVLEATILATRLPLVGRRQIDEELKRMKTILDKTAGPREWLAWELVTNHVARAPCQSE